MPETVADILQDLTGQDPPFSHDVDKPVSRLLPGSGVGYSQINELLLLLGYDRISPVFFQYLLDGKSQYVSGSAFKSLDELRSGVDRFRTLAILRFGNVKYAFKRLSALPEEGLTSELRLLDPVDDSEFLNRHDPLVPIQPISGDRTYYLGYLIKRELDDRLTENPNDEQAKQELKRRDEVVDMGKRNHEAYMASDHMDVYVATSMRERHEYQMVNEVVAKVFSNPQIKDLKIRWFDPTQAYCEDRIDKGLAEALMLKRATCTLYLAQESDTLGKDSELASTLAQGKPVIAFVPQLTDANQKTYVSDLLKMIRHGRPKAEDRHLVLEQLRVFCPEAAWRDREVMGWVADPSTMDSAVARQKLAKCIREHYDKRATTLKESHPLGIQVHLDTGVANGVLVARSTEQCADLIRRVLTNRLEFVICPKMIGGHRYLLLKEKVSQSVFRVVSGDRFLTNAFWNFYLSK